MPFKDSPEGQTHSFNDGCGEQTHNEVIVCAAIHVEEVEGPQLVENARGFVAIGKRHNHCLQMLRILGVKREWACNGEQGFMTSHRRFVGREEAAKIAFTQGQIAKQQSTLYSEDLY